MTTNGWHYTIGGTKFGPKSDQEMAALVASGTITPDTLVWRPGMGVWARAADSPLDGVFDLIPPPPPPSEEAPRAYAPEPVGGPTSNNAGPAPAMDFKEAVRTCFEKYFTFSGRGSRSQFWYFTLFIWIAGIVTLLLDSAIGFDAMDGNGPISALFSLATLFPNLAATSRRFHDAGWSFWWFLIVLVPVLGWIFVLYVLISAPEPGPNRFDRF